MLGQETLRFGDDDGDADDDDDDDGYVQAAAPPPTQSAAASQPASSEPSSFSLDWFSWWPAGDVLFIIIFFVFCLSICICFSCWTRPDDVLFTSILYQLVELSERHFRSFKFINVSTKYCRGLLEGMILKSMALKEGSGRFKTNKKLPKYCFTYNKLIELVKNTYHNNPGQPHGSHLNS